MQIAIYVQFLYKMYIPILCSFVHSQTLFCNDKENNIRAYMGSYSYV